MPPIRNKDVHAFAAEMERVLASHAPEKGDTWRTCPVSHLRAGLRQELVEAMQDGADKSEYVDLANYAMMLWSRRKQQEEGGL